MTVTSDIPINSIRAAWHAPDMKLAAELVYNAYRSRIERFLQRGLASSAEAQDALSIWSMKLVTALPEFDWTLVDATAPGDSEEERHRKQVEGWKRKLTGWVFVLVRRARFQIIADRKRNPVAEPASSQQDAAADASSFHTLNDVPEVLQERALALRATLDEEEQELMLLYGDRRQALAWAEVVSIMSGEDLDPPARAVEERRLRQRWSRAKRKLQDAAEHLGLRQIADDKRALVNARKRR